MPLGPLLGFTLPDLLIGFPWHVSGPPLSPTQPPCSEDSLSRSGKVRASPAGECLLQLSTPDPLPASLYSGPCTCLPNLVLMQFLEETFYFLNLSLPPSTGKESIDGCTLLCTRSNLAWRGRGFFVFFNWPHSTSILSLLPIFKFRWVQWKNSSQFWLFLKPQKIWPLWLEQSPSFPIRPFGHGPCSPDPPQPHLCQLTIYITCSACIGIWSCNLWSKDKLCPDTK